MSSEPERNPSSGARLDASIDRLLQARTREATSPVSGECVDAEQLAAWSAGTLREDEALAVEVHLADCARCQSMLAAFVQAEPAAPAAVPLWRRLPALWLVPIASAAVLLLVFWARPKPGEPPTAAVTTARLEPAAPVNPPAATSEPTSRQRVPSVEAPGATAPAARIGGGWRRRGRSEIGHARRQRNRPRSRQRPGLGVERAERPAGGQQRQQRHARRHLTNACAAARSGAATPARAAKRDRSRAWRRGGSDRPGRREVGSDIDGAGRHRRAGRHRGRFAGRHHSRCGRARHAQRLGRRRRRHGRGRPIPHHRRRPWPIRCQHHDAELSARVPCRGQRVERHRNGRRRDAAGRAGGGSRGIGRGGPALTFDSRRRESSPVWCRRPAPVWRAAAAAEAVAAAGARPRSAALRRRLRQRRRRRVGGFSE